MGTATLGGSYFESGWRPTGRRYFALRFNDTVGAGGFTDVRVPQVLFDNAINMAVTITNVELLYSDADSAGSVRISYPFLTLAPANNVAYLSTHTTTAGAYDSKAWTNIEACVRGDSLVVGAALAFFPFVGSAATDTAIVVIRGYIEQPRRVEMQPVSVEELKVWPWHRG